MIFKNASRHLLMATCLCAGVAIASPVLAQAPSQPSAPAATQAPAPEEAQPSAPAATQPAAPAPNQPSQATSVTDEKLETFVVALAEVERIKQEYSQRLQTAGSEAEQQQIQNEAGQKMLQAVEGKGISVDEYNQIIQTAQTDPALAERLSKAMGQSNQ
ncbi:MULTISPECIES: DUF4168 domain-containing protein [Chelativorans]|uniref:DUF4168 domain-containing protein n=1 Tax=Chelativorans sp. (strain BNC1) TaxID=266779 RepID=Q11II1_CHESB